MKPMTAKLRQLGFLLARAGLRHAGGAPRIVFIMGHMRSGSTLLTHILLTHPEIIGCGERNVAYRSRDDLDKLEIAARLERRSLFRPISWVADQLNHDIFTPGPELLRCDRIRCVLLLRDPHETIQSLLNLTKPFSTDWPVERAVDYYVNRTNSLAAYAEMLGERAMALTYADLVDRTPAALRRVESFLCLTSELPQEYTMQRFTGKRGDPSDGIRLGRIERRTSVNGFLAPQREIQRAIEAYSSCLRRLSLCPASVH
jgi:hypothetical protein